MYYSATLPPLNSSSYVKDDLTDKSLFTHHIHYFKDFFGSYPEPFCNKEDYATAFMAAEFPGLDAVYFT